MKIVNRSLATGLLVAFASLVAVAQSTTFRLVRSAGAEAGNGIPAATGRASINKLGDVEILHLEVGGLPPNAEFEAFIVQLPNSPFGLSWYQGDVTTDANGKGAADFIGRFSRETFIVAPGSGAAPVVDNFDANTNPILAARAVRLVSLSDACPVQPWMQGL